MRRTFWLLLVLAGCAGPDSDPIKVAERFHDLRMAGDDAGIHALLTEADRAAVPLDAFPAALPAGATRQLLGRLEVGGASASLLSTGGDTAAVVLQGLGGGQDTLRLVATPDPLRLWRYERVRVRWRVSMGLAERALLDSLAARVRADAGATDPAAVEGAVAYLRTAELYPAMARPADVAAADALLRTGEVVEGLRVELHITRSIGGVPFLEGRVRNPSDTRIATLRLTVRDDDGAQEQIELWEVGPRSTTSVRQITQLRSAPLTSRVARIQVY
jgi:hypothetical protein